MPFYLTTMAVCATAAPHAPSRFIQPEMPAHFICIPDEYQPGTYLVAHDKFRLSDDIHVTSLVHRQFSSADEFFLGMLSVLLIAILTEIFHVIVLRTSGGKRQEVSKQRLLSAFLFSELAHLRNILRHFMPSSLYRNRQREVPNLPTGTTTLSVAVLFVGVIVFAIDVFIIVVTQPQLQLSTAYEYNLRGEQPVMTHLGLSAYIGRMAEDRPCVSPIMANASHPRRFKLQSCVFYSFQESSVTKETVVPNVTIKSFFHSAGADHNLSFGSAWFAYKIRVDVLLDSSIAGGYRHILFDSRETASFESTRYMHKMIIYRAKEKACPGDVYDNPELCANATNSSEPVNWYPRKSRIELWPGTVNDIVGVVSEFHDVHVINPFRFLRTSSRLLLPGAVIYETSGSSSYINGKNSTVLEVGIPHMFSERSRAAGVALLSLVLGILIFVLLVLRFCLQPTSLADMAVEKVDKAIARVPAREVFIGTGIGVPVSYDHRQHYDITTW